MVSLEQLGCSRVSTGSSTLVSESSISVLREILGQASAEAVPYHLSRVMKLSKEQILSDYNLVKQSLESLFGHSARLIVSSLEKEILSRAKAPKPMSVEELLETVGRREVQEFVTNLPTKEHVVLLYGDTAARDQMISAFFDHDGSKGYVSERPSSLDGVSNMLYGEMLDGGGQLQVQKLHNWIGQLNATKQAQSTRIAGEDIWFFENGYDKEIIALERAIGRYAADNTTILCTYDISRLDSERIGAMIETHSYIITDKPCMIYQQKSQASVMSV